MLPPVRSVHFVGICGTAMASAAAAMREKGYVVTGSDENVYPPMSLFLEERDIEIRRGYAEANLSPAPDLVVIGNALSRGNTEIEAVLERKLRYCSLPELLKQFFIWGKRSIVVSGTHGKTTTASILAWILEENGLNPSYLIGGVPNNLGRGARFSDGEWFVIEGDEYDTAFFDKRSKFLHYLPEIAVINNIEFDHADIFDSLAAIQRSFSRLINLVPRNGLLFANGDDSNVTELLNVPHCLVQRFGFGSGNDLRGTNVACLGDQAEVDFCGARYRIPMAGELNVRNAMAAVACARRCGLSADQIQKALESFSGIKRRMEHRGTRAGVAVIDDFGHHPTAVRETLRALRAKFPKSRLWAVFEPRSNTTRRKVFQSELTECLSLADCIVVAEVARLAQLPRDERLDPEKLIQTLQAKGRAAVYLPAVDEIVEHVRQAACPGDVVCVFSNGGFGDIHAKLLAELTPHLESPA